MIRPTWRAFATAATAVKRRGNCGKTARKRNDDEAQNGASLGRWRAMRGASCGDPCTLPRGQKSFDPASADRMPPFTRKIFPTGKCGRGCCGGAAELVRVLRGRSGIGSAAQPAGLPAEIRMISVSELDTGRLAASKACVPTRGIDVDALGGRFRRCAGWECRPARVFLSSGRRRSPPASGRSSEHIEEVSGCSAC